MDKLLNTIICDDVLSGMKRIPDESVDCVITSPPYWQLRDYGFSGQWGLEPTFDEYLEKLLKLMDEVWRVLKDSGTVWVNLGDTYSGSGNGQRDKDAASRIGGKCYANQNYSGVKSGKTSVRNKSLILVPHRFAIGCIDRGWILRNDIIWAKRNGMPEGVTDRFTKKHEYVFFMVKSEKYFFDLDAIKDSVSIHSVKMELRKNRKDTKYGKDEGRPNGVHAQTLSKPRAYRGYSSIDAEMLAKKGKNPGSVSDFWDIPTKPSLQNHYASYNDSLIAKPILAGCPEGGVILDPFMGTGSTAEAAIRAGRNFIGIDASEEYCKLANKRLEPFLLQGQLFL